MRRTVTLEADVVDAVKALMRDQGVGFKQALNELVNRGCEPTNPPSFQTRTFELGEPAIPLDKAIALTAVLEDEELLAKAATHC